MVTETLSARWGLRSEASDRGPRLVGLLSVLLAVAVHSVTGCFLLLGQLGLGGQQGGEGEEAGGGGDGGEARLAQAQRQRGHGQSQALELRQLVSLELLLHRITTRQGSEGAGWGRGQRGIKQIWKL